MRREPRPFVAETESPHLFPRARARHRIFRGLNERQEHIFTWIAVVVVLLYVTGWIGAIHTAYEDQREMEREAKEAGVKLPPPPPAPPIATQIFQPDAPTTAFIDDAMLGFLNPLRGHSGKVYFTTVTPGAPIASGAPGGAKAVLTEGPDKVSSDFTAPDQPGVYKMAVQLNQAMRQLDNFNVITLVPFSEKHAGHIGTYYLGSWPFESGGTPKTPAYANPNGFIEVTRENADTPISAHFKLRNFLTKDQPNVWPKYLLLNPKLLDKLELTIQELEAMGHPVHHYQIMSGFRTPEYNHGGGNTQGRANLSRHMYGDASDTFVDNDGNGMMDDLNGDGRVDVRDAEVVMAAVERVERKNPSLVGGVGVYSACCGHGPFTHIDVRGYRARWRGTGSG
ncbi:MAG TPA: hypothetical protein VGQ65_11935 [Thermoanaerobaculia bacterium]|jgi:uncharacterized protein YcbK (DUF882 family)|nr:hypothetical protein [Thermoanaerobaculia bacterium]